VIDWMVENLPGRIISSGKKGSAEN